MLTEIKLSHDFLFSMKKGDFGTNRRKMKLHLFVTREKESFLIKTIFRDKQNNHHRERQSRPLLSRTKLGS
jgi:hypothetical protein